MYMIKKDYEKKIKRTETKMAIIDEVKGVIIDKLVLKYNTTEERLVSQKKVYILQSMGVDLGYRYGWYFRGPYSGDLAEDLSELSAWYLSNAYGERRLNNKALEVINTINYLDTKRSDKFSKGIWYELLGSLLYIYRNSKSFHLDENNMRGSIIVELRKLLPQFTSDQCEYGLRVVERDILHAKLTGSWTEVEEVQILTA